MERKTYEDLSKLSCCVHLQEEKDSVNLHSQLEETDCFL